MADIGKSLKTAWMKSMEAIGNTASSIASNTKYKVNEMNLINRRREILSEFGAKAYELWQKGVSFPEELENELKELGELDSQLNAIRTERLAGVKTEADDVAPEGDDAPAAADEEASAEDTNKADDADVPTLNIPEDDNEGKGDAAPLSDTFDALTRHQQDAAVKVDSAIDTLGDTMVHMGHAIDDAIAGMSDKLDDKDHPQE